MTFDLVFSTFTLTVMLSLLISSGQVGATSTSTSPSGAGSTSSAGSSVFGGGDGQQSTSSGSGSSSGGSGGSGSSSSNTGTGPKVIARYPVPYDLKSLANPHWVSFLEEVATQTSRDLVDLRANGVNDPTIGLMWDVYVQTLSDGAALPSIGNGGGGGGGGFDGPVMSLYEGGAQLDGSTGLYSAPSSRGNWFRSFFTDPADKIAGKSMFNSFMQVDQTTPAAPVDSGLNSNSFGSTASSPAAGGQAASSGPSYNAQHSSSPSSKGFSMEQMFSKFRTQPSSGQRQQSSQQYPRQQQQQYRPHQQQARPQQYQQQARYPQQQKPNQTRWFTQFRKPSSQQQQSSLSSGVNGRAVAQRFYDMVSPILMKSLSSQQTSRPRSPQSSFRASSLYGSRATLPDTGFNTGGHFQSGPPRPQQPVPQTPKTLPKLSEATMRRLSDELMRLLGKTPMNQAPSPAASPSLTSSSSSSSSTRSQHQPRHSRVMPHSQQQQLRQQSAPQPKPKRQPSSPWQLQNVESLPASAGLQAAIGNRLLNTPTNQVQAGRGQTTSFDSLLADLGSSKSTLTSPALAPPGTAANTLFTALKPVAHFYNARHRARASRDLGCKTLGEMLDMDVPRPMDLNCNRLCPTIMPGAVRGKRFGLTCLCCPAYVSDQAIGIRSMYRRAESLT